MNSGSMYLLCTEESRVGPRFSIIEQMRPSLAPCPTYSLFPAPSYPQFSDNYFGENFFSECTAQAEATKDTGHTDSCQALLQAGVPNVICKCMASVLNKLQQLRRLTVNEFIPTKDVLMYVHVSPPCLRMSLPASCMRTGRHIRQRNIVDPWVFCCFDG